MLVKLSAILVGIVMACVVVWVLYALVSIGACILRGGCA